MVVQYKKKMGYIICYLPSSSTNLPINTCHRALLYWKIYFRRMANGRFDECLITTGRYNGAWCKSFSRWCCCCCCCCCCWAAPWQIINSKITHTEYNKYYLLIHYSWTLPAAVIADDVLLLLAYWNYFDMLFGCAFGFWRIANLEYILTTYIST